MFSIFGFYDNLISSGTKISDIETINSNVFYDNLISSGTKMLITKMNEVTEVLR